MVDGSGTPDQSSTPLGGRTTDLVLEGGGVKGIALAGAVQALGAAGYNFGRVAGTSAGALVGAVVAAMQQRGESVDRLEEIARTLDYRKFRDRALPGSLVPSWGPLGYLGDALGVLTHDGAYAGDHLRDWVAGVLGDFGVRTFGDLRVDDPGGDGAVHHRYRLVIIASDLSRRRLVQLPWDYADYGLDPDEQPVADAVRASASVPFLFEPVQLAGRSGTSTLVDGGLLSNYPISVFDRLDEQPPRWPTIGVRLNALGIGEPAHVAPVDDPVAMGIALVETSIEACQAEHLLDPCNIARSVAVDTADVPSFDFDLTREQQDLLLRRGRAAAERFLRHWDFQAWLHRCRGLSTSRSAGDGARRTKVPPTGG
jgi:NTE family protein